MNHIANITKTFTAIATSIMLTACGGGGGTTTTTTVTTTTAAAVPIVTTVPTAPGAYNAEQLAAFNTFNSARSTCGFGYLTQSSKIDTAASNHVSYMVSNQAPGHNETPGLLGFTGVNGDARMVAAGYQTSGWGEVVAVEAGAINSNGYGSLFAKRLLAAPYHLEGLMQGNRDIGISVKSSGASGSGADIISAAGYTAAWLVADMASSAAAPAQAQASTDVLTYPCAGVAGTSFKVVSESPSPVPGRNLGSQPIGQPIFVQALAGQTLVVNTVTVTGPLGSVALLPTMTNANDPNHLLHANQAVIMPDSPLSMNTPYTVSITGTHDGVAFSTNFTFSTGSAF